MPELRVQNVTYILITLFMIHITISLRFDLILLKTPELTVQNVTYIRITLVQNVTYIRITLVQNVTYKLYPNYISAKCFLYPNYSSSVPHDCLFKPLDLYQEYTGIG